MPTIARRAAALVLTALAAAQPGCGPASEATSARAEASPPPTRVVVARPERGTIRRVTSEPGQVLALEVAAVRAKIAGFVRTMAVHIGDRVERDQVLAEIFVPEVEAELRQKRATIDSAEAQQDLAESEVKVAEANIDSAKAKVLEAEAGINRADADLEFWRLEYGRSSQLVSRGAETQSLLDESRSRLRKAEAARAEAVAIRESARAALAEVEAQREKAKANVIAANSEIDVARSDAERAEALLAYAKILAPFDGVVIERPIDPGHMTNGQGSGDPLFVVARQDIARIVVGVPEVDAPFVDVGDPAEVRLQALPGRTFKGKVTRTAWALDAATRTLRAEIDLENPEGLLRPGLYAYATIIAEEHPDALTVPASAVVREGGAAYVVVVEDGRARRREIVSGLTEGKQVEVVTGLDGTEAIVVSGAASLIDGQAAQAVEPSTP